MQKPMSQAAYEARRVTKIFRTKNGLRIWTQKIVDAIKVEKGVYRLILSNINCISRNRYKLARNYAKGPVRKTRQEYSDRFIKNIGNNLHGSHITAYKRMKLLSKVVVNIMLIV